jgi:hypothetical protein
MPQSEPAGAMITRLAKETPIVKAVRENPWWTLWSGSATDVVSSATIRIPGHRRGEFRTDRDRKAYENNSRTEAFGLMNYSLRDILSYATCKACAIFDFGSIPFTEW